ncbi:glycosyltransferase family 39 protein [Acaryochloris sp. CCMEE 5410]|uniref:glycosyltransferase family 39 protein n=1 Tax=Acaryochloris sp. CCMEE 5410 TaxID=310037 RepID=UPI0005856216|nr:glycosyltransferase family 39 protein [Acaryochloris sp. CCMEE 5410]KAI9133980.1 glycosyltransferase family 39 protein [Acaryochloris sp. CCMEE 5410]
MQKPMQKTSLDTRFSGNKSIQEFLPFGLVFLLAIFLFFYQLDSESLWNDEVFSIRDANNIRSKFLISRPLYFFLLHIWMQLGTSEFWMRSLSVLFALASVGLIYVLGQRLDSKATGVISALLLTLSPLFINHAQEIRMYALGTCLGLAGTLALTIALQERKIAPFFAWAIARWLMFVTAPLNIALVFADFFLVGLQFWRHRKLLFMFGVSALFLGAACLPTFLITAKGSGDVLLTWAQYQPRPGLKSLPGMLTRFTIWSVKPPFDIAALGWLINAYTLVLVGIVIFLIATKPWKSSVGWIIVWWFIPQAAVFVVSHLTSSLWVERYLLFTAPYALVMLAAGFTRMWKWKWPIALGIVILYSIVVGGGLFRYYATSHRSDWRGVVQTISKSEQAGDHIAIHANPTLFKHYYRGSAPTQFMDIVSKKRLPEEIDQVLEDIPAFDSRLWLTYEHTAFVDEEGHDRFRQAVVDKFTLQKKQEFEDVDLFLLTPKSK